METFEVGALYRSRGGIFYIALYRDPDVVGWHHLVLDNGAENSWCSPGQLHCWSIEACIFDERLTGGL